MSFHAEGTGLVRSRRTTRGTAVEEGGSYRLSRGIADVAGMNVGGAHGDQSTPLQTQAASRRRSRLRVIQLRFSTCRSARAHPSAPDKTDTPSWVHMLFIPPNLHFYLQSARPRGASPSCCPASCYLENTRIREVQGRKWTTPLTHLSSSATMSTMNSTQSTFRCSADRRKRAQSLGAHRRSPRAHPLAPNRAARSHPSPPLPMAHRAQWARGSRSAAQRAACSATRVVRARRRRWSSSASRRRRQRGQRPSRRRRRRPRLRPSS